MKLPFAYAALLVSPFVIDHALAQQQPAQPANFDIRVSSALRNDLAGLYIKMGQLAGCDVACHVVLSRALVALDAATPVAESAPPVAEDKK